MGFNGTSAAVEMMPRFLAYPQCSAKGEDCAWIAKDLDTERFRVAPAEFGDLWIKALSSSTDSAFLTLYMSTELDLYQKAVAEADKFFEGTKKDEEIKNDEEIKKEGEITDNENKDENKDEEKESEEKKEQTQVNKRAACAEILASIFRGFSFMTLVPESLETLVSLPPCFPVIVKAFKLLADRFIKKPEWRESLAAPLGYALMIFANATPAQYLWGHPGNVKARAAIQPFASMQQFKHLCASALKTLDTEDVPKIIVDVIETLAAEGGDGDDGEGEASWKPCKRLLPVLLDTLGAISNGNKEFLEKLIASTPILDVVAKTLSEKPRKHKQSEEESNAMLMFKINAYRFVYFLL